MKIQAVLLDVGGTLIAPQPSVGAIYAEVAARHGVRVRPEFLNEEFRKAWADHKGSSPFIDKSWWRRVVDRVFSSFKFSAPDAFFEDVYEIFRKPESWRIFPDVPETLSGLKKLGLKLAIASNWDSRLPELLDTLKLSNHFHYQFISFALGLNKSDPQFYRECLTTLQLPASAVIHVGDDQENDYHSPTEAGIRSFLIRRGEPTGDHFLTRLTDLLPIAAAFARETV